MRAINGKAAVIGSTFLPVTQTGVEENNIL